MTVKATAGVKSSYSYSKLEANTSDEYKVLHYYKQVKLVPDSLTYISCWAMNNVD